MGFVLSAQQLIPPRLIHKQIHYEEFIIKSLSFRLFNSTYAPKGHRHTNRTLPPTLPSNAEIRIYNCPDAHLYTPTNPSSPPSPPLLNFAADRGEGPRVQPRKRVLRHPESLIRRFRQRRRRRGRGRRGRRQRVVVVLLLLLIRLQGLPPVPAAHRVQVTGGE